MVNRLTTAVGEPEPVRGKGDGGPAFAHHLGLARALLGRLGLDDPDGGHRPRVAPATVTSLYGSGRRAPSSAARPLHLPMRLPERPEGAALDAQQHLVAQAIAALAGMDRPDRAVELACGTGANTVALATACPDWRFTGLDLLPTQVAAAQSAPARPANASFAVADFARLPLAPGRSTLVFSVEGLVYASDVDAVLRGARTALRLGGELLMIEIFRAAGFDEVPPPWDGVGPLAERLLAVPALRRVDDWIRAAADHGFELVESRDLTAQVLPELGQLAQVGEQAIRQATGLPDTWLRLILTGLFTRYSLRAGAHSYALVRLVRRR